MAKPKKPERDRVCGNCLHWVPDDGDRSSGYCQRYPPNVLYDADEGLFSVFPATPPEYWCGEHKASQ